MIVPTEKGNIVAVDYTTLALAFFGNCIALRGVLKGKFSLVGYRRFLLSLIASDLFICFIRLLLYLNQALAELLATSGSFHQGALAILRSLFTLALFINLLNLCAMSIDHFVGLVYPHKYRYLMEKGIAKHSVLIVWLIALLFAFGDAFISTAIFVGRSSNAGAPTMTLQSVQQMPAKMSTPSNVDCLAMLASMPSTTFEPYLTRKRQGREVTQMPASSAAPPLFLQKSTKKLIAAKSISKATKPVSTKLRRKFVVGSTAISRMPPITPSLMTTKASDVIQQTAEWLTSDFEVEDWLAVDDFINRELKNEMGGIDSIDLCKKLITSGAAEMFRFSTKATFSQILSTQARGHFITTGGIGALFGADYWHYVNSNKIWTELVLVVWALLVFIILTICYGKAYFNVCPNNVADKHRRNIRKLVLTTWLLLGVFALTWMPLMLYEMSMFAIALIAKRPVLSSNTYFTIHDVLNSIFLMNPLIDTLIYVVRVKPVQKVLSDYYRRFCFCCVSKHQKENSVKTFIQRAARPMLQFTIAMYRPSATSFAISGLQRGNTILGRDNANASSTSSRRNNCTDTNQTMSTSLAHRDSGNSCYFDGATSKRHHSIVRVRASIEQALREEQRFARNSCYANDDPTNIDSNVPASSSLEPNASANVSSHDDKLISDNADNDAGVDKFRVLNSQNVSPIIIANDSNCDTLADDNRTSQQNVSFLESINPANLANYKDIL